MPRTLARESEGFLRETEEGLGFGGMLIWPPASFLVVSLAILLMFVGEGDLALVFSWETLFPDWETLFPAGKATPFLGSWQGAGGAFEVPASFVGVPVASFRVLRLRTGSLVVPPGVLWVGVGILEIPPERLRGGVGKLGRPVVVAPSIAVPLLAVPPPRVLLTGTGSLDFQACWVPVPRTCVWGGGTAATPLCSRVPTNLLAVGGMRECLPVAATETVVGAMSLFVEVF